MQASLQAGMEHCRKGLTGLNWPTPKPLKTKLPNLGRTMRFCCLLIPGAR